MLHVWRFKKFSDGRWASVVETSKTLLASLALGLDSVVAAVRGRESETDYYLHGYTRFSVELRRACSVAAIAGNVAGQMIESLLEDDRVCLRAEELRDQLTEELEYVASLGDDIFQR